MDEEILSEFDYLPALSIFVAGLADCLGHAGPEVWTTKVKVGHCKPPSFSRRIL